VVRRDCVRRFGGFEESVGSYAVDSCTWIPFSFHARMVLQPEPVLLRRFHGDNITGNIRGDAWAWLRLLERLRAEQPAFCREHGDAVRRVAAKTWVRYGREVLAASGGAKDEVAEARRALREALRERPWFPRAWRYLALSWLAPRVYGSLRRAELSGKSFLFRRRLGNPPSGKTPTNRVL
jgi:hypothetical protein